MRQFRYQVELKGHGKASKEEHLDGLNDHELQGIRHAPIGKHLGGRILTKLGGVRDAQEEHHRFHLWS
tara:strand:- start:627 stop:830 length:204 start_codon:yes stop_codon:yes gene_type:complete